MANGDKFYLGTLYVNGKKVFRPEVPQHSSKNGSGDLFKFKAENVTDITIGDTNPNEPFQLKWVEANYNGKMLYISDRCLVEGMTALDAESLQLNGKVVTIDGKRYTLRMMTGGSESDSFSDSYNGGMGLPANEWDEVFLNNAELPGLIKWDNSSSSDSAFNKFWNYQNTASMCMEKNAKYPTYHVYRGPSDNYWPATRWKSYSENSILNTGAWRPVLEPYGSAPTTSLKDNENLGVVYNYITKTYTCDSGAENKLITIEERLDDEVLRRYETNSGTENMINLQNKWNEIDFGKHQLIITITNTFQESTTVYITFVKGSDDDLSRLPESADVDQIISYGNKANRELRFQKNFLNDRILEAIRALKGGN